MCDMTCVCKCYPSDGFVAETKVKSLLGPALYSDCSVGQPDNLMDASFKTEHDTFLNKVSRTFIAGILGGIARLAIGIIHTIGHLFAAIFTRQKGHLFHAAKGASEMLRGLIEAIPVGGRIFASVYNPSGCGRNTVDPDVEKGRTWWIIKIHNPLAPDNFDRYMNNWIPQYHANGQQLPFTQGGSRYLKA